MDFTKPFAKYSRDLIPLILYSLVLIFLGLGDSVLQEDEGMDTFVTTTILKYGVPMHSDGVNSTMLFADIFDGLFVYRTWIPYYLQAMTVSVFGHTSFAARLPFAIAGICSVIALYFFTLKLTGKRSVAFLSGLFLASSVPALLYFRTARYVGLPILFTIALLYFYCKIFEDKKWNPVPFTVTAVLYFHIMYVEFSGTLLGILVHFALYRKSLVAEKIKIALASGLVIGLFTLPWLIVISPVFEKVTMEYLFTSELVDSSGLGIVKHLAGFLFQINNYIFPFLLLVLWIWKPPGIPKREIHLLAISIAAIIATACIHSIPLQQYIVACYPLLFILLALVITECLPANLILQSSLAILLIGSNLLHVGPLLPVKKVLQNYPQWFSGSESLEYSYRGFVREATLSSPYFSYWWQISHPFEGSLDAVVEFLQARGKAGDTFYIDSERESLSFHTGMKYVPDEEILPHNLPDWIILRGNHWFEEGEVAATTVGRRLQEAIRANPTRKIELDAPVVRVNNSYEIQLHLFESPSTERKIQVYRRIR